MLYLSELGANLSSQDMSLFLSRAVSLLQVSHQGRPRADFPALSVSALSLCLVSSVLGAICYCTLLYIYATHATTIIHNNCRGHITRPQVSATPHIAYILFNPVYFLSLMCTLQYSQYVVTHCRFPVYTVTMATLYRSTYLQHPAVNNTGNNTVYFTSGWMRSAFHWLHTWTVHKDNKDESGSTLAL